MPMQIALQVTVTRMEQMQRCMLLTERTSTARLRTPCWMPWRLQRRSTMPRNSQVLPCPFFPERLVMRSLLSMEAWRKNADFPPTVCKAFHIWTGLSEVGHW